MNTDGTSVPQGFAALGLSPRLVAAVTALGYEEPTPIQREAIPLLLKGRDLFGQAGTGTGKTAAFALPLIDRLASSAGSARKTPRALILVPTRELAMQVAEAVHTYAKRSSLTIVALYGGAPMGQQIRALARGADVVVATPGRAIDHLGRETLVLDALEVLVVDEADEMLDMGFADDLEILLTATPASRQTALFAATFAPRITAIAERHLKNPSRVHIKAERRPAGKLPRVRQIAYVVSRPQKTQALNRVLEFEDPASAIIFCRTRVEVDELSGTLASHGYAVLALHGGMEQRQRDRVMQRFRQEKAEVLVATDVAARGLDIDHVSHVINYDIPTAPEVYVHRIGRTGRIGREGTAITLLDPREQRLLRLIEGVTKQRIDIGSLPTADALRLKRLDVTRTSVVDRLAGRDLQPMRALVESLAQEFDVIEIAAAALALLHERDAPPADAGTPFPEDRRPAGAPMATIFIGAGSDAHIRPGDLVGAITGEARVGATDIGAIRVNRTHSLVQVRADLADSIIRALRLTTIKGRTVNVRPDRESGDTPRRTSADRQRRRSAG